MGVDGAGLVRPLSPPSATPPAIELTRFHILRPSHEIIVPDGAHFRMGNGGGPIFLSATRMTGRDCRAMHCRSPARRGTWPTGITD